MLWPPPNSPLLGLSLILCFSLVFCLILRLSFSFSLNLSLSLSISLLPFECCLLSPHHQREGVQAITYWKKCYCFLKITIWSTSGTVFFVVYCASFFLQIQVRKIYSFKLLLNYLKKRKNYLYFSCLEEPNRDCAPHSQIDPPFQRHR